MGLFMVESANAVPLKTRQPGIQLTLENPTAVDVFWSYDPDTLNASAPGTIPVGNKLPAAAGGVNGKVQLFPYFSTLWLRAVQQVQILVTP